MLNLACNAAILPFSLDIKDSIMDSRCYSSCLSQHIIWPASVRMAQAPKAASLLVSFSIYYIVNTAASITETAVLLCFVDAVMMGLAATEPVSWWWSSAFTIRWIYG